MKNWNVMFKYHLKWIIERVIKKKAENNLKQIVKLNIIKYQNYAKVIDIVTISILYFWEKATLISYYLMQAK